MISNYSDIYGAIIPRFTGGLSAIASALIMFIILRSQTKLSSTYHRLMFAISLTDFMSSVALSLTTLPMPTQMPKEQEFGYSWAGTRIGNTRTCTAQGFFNVFGIYVTFCYNTSLCIYYGCAIGLNMRQGTMSKILEPILHLIPIAIGSTIAFPPLFHDLYNPSKYEAWCTIAPYPHDCEHDSEKLDENPDLVMCIRGIETTDMVSRFTLYAIAYIFVISFVSLSTAVCRLAYNTYQTNRYSRYMETQGFHIEEVHVQIVKARQREMKVALIQATAYIAALVLTLFSTIITKMPDSAVGRAINENLLELILLPLQGVFNFLIFAGHEVYAYRRANECTKCEALSHLFCTSSNETVLLSHLSIVLNDHFNDAEEAMRLVRQSMMHTRSMQEGSRHEENSNGNSSMVSSTYEEVTMQDEKVDEDSESRGMSALSVFDISSLPASGASKSTQSSSDKSKANSAPTQSLGFPIHLDQKVKDKGTQQDIEVGKY